jgi:hypothetical protein
LCEGVSQNVGYYYRVTFPNVLDDSSWSFQTPTDFSNGGINMLDGTIINKYTEDTWTEGTPSTKLDFTVTLSKGNHVIEYYGSQACCDGTTAWKFQVNGGEWLDLTIDNLDNYMIVPAVPYTTVAEFGDINVLEG